MLKQNKHPKQNIWWLAIICVHKKINLEVHMYSCSIYTSKANLVGGSLQGNLKMPGAYQNCV